MNDASPETTAWQSVHVYYEGRQEALLTECIGPLIASARRCGLARWFFIRYWKGGPHVRVRCQFERGALPAAWEALVARIGDYLREKPSERRLDVDQLEQSHRLLTALEGEAAEAVQIHPNNTIAPMPYEPEEEKYGGPAGVALAESLFGASSDIVLDVLRDPAAKANGRVNVAFAMMLAGLRAAGYGERELVAVLAAYARFTERYVMADAWQSLQAKVQRPEVLRRFSGAMASSAASGRAPAWLQRWSLAFGATARALHEHAAAVRPAVTIARKMDPLQFVLFNYLHTHNNRLGVTPALEAQIAYLAHHILAHHVGAEAEDVRV